MVLKKKEPITEAFDALKRIDELEKENKILKNKVKKLRFDLLRKEEREWVMNVFDMLYPDVRCLPFHDERGDFKCKYMDFKDSLPINDFPF